jgi:murein DD-endopeptidase MepM/ murein hydrolase activator NlpD
MAELTAGGGGTGEPEPLWGESGEILGSADLARASPTTDTRVGGALTLQAANKGSLMGRTRTVVAVVWGLVLTLGAGAPAADAGSGGAFASQPVAISAVSCVAGCAGVDAAQAGSLLRIRGTSMSKVEKVVFLGGSGFADNATVTVVKQRHTSVDVNVPAPARSGPLRAVNRDGARSQPSRVTVSIQRGDSGNGPLDVRVVGRHMFLAGARRARIDVLAREPMAATIALVRLSDAALVASWPLGALEPGLVRTVTWDGTTAGVAQPAGRYEFRVFGDGGGVQAAQAGAAVVPLATGAFDLLDHKFPVRGRHTFGDGVAAFGAVRDGHAHQGQDVFADCGTPLVAARGGIVKLNQHDEKAGNYLVVDGADTDVDYVYMHMREPSPLKKGAPVVTGQPIGAVGDTGDADGCHLHFEMWSAPGWYTGGAPFDPLPFLEAWDAYS